ncbi:MAG: HAMP domain-containing histidine kinase [Eubacterium sp.]|nr:HAMP domain-containing histidine kinase [Eubacterium sp.]
MKFRYKVLLINIIIISLTLSISGYLMMSRQNRMLLDSEIKNAVTENNLAQSVIEYSILDIINNTDSDLANELPSLADQVSVGMISETSDLYVRFDSKLLYSTEKGELKKIKIPLFVNSSTYASDSDASFLFSGSNDIRKRYIITKIKDDYYIYVTSNSIPDNRVLNIITRRNITETEKLMNKSIRDFRLFTIAMLILSGILVYLITRLLTRPLEKLNKVTDSFAEGDFSARSDVHSKDEIGLLSGRFNHMADSVEDHIVELNDMIHRRDQFVADFTHEIKTPMTTIIGYADTIRSVDLPREDEIKAANYIFSEGQRLELMSSHLFDLIYLKDAEVPKQPVNTVALGDAVIQTISPSLEKAGITLTSSFDNATINGDSALLKTAFINLIDNARKASSEGSEIAFTGKETDDAYVFVVEDHGIGIAEEDIDRICDEFYMVDKSRSRKEGGAGLGLSLVSAILKEHDATLDIKSKLGKGTVISIGFKYE